MGSERFSDSIERFHERASAARQRTDFGEDDYREALEVLCRSLDEDARLTPVGEAAHEDMIIAALEARLLCEAGWREHPEAKSNPIERPLFIIGLPRTGTTVLHHLFGQDPTMQTLEHWIQRTPKPRPPIAEWHQDSDFTAAARRLDEMFARSPDLRAIHEIDAHLPDECWNTFSQNFAHCSYESNADVSQYAAWWAKSDMGPVYRRHKRNAQLIGLNEREKRWVFKDATHLFGLERLLETYPDAIIVQTHRDPVPVIASVCSLCFSVREALNLEIDVEAFARSTLSLWERGIDAMMNARATRDPAQFYDLPFDRITANPVEALREIYIYFGIDYTNRADQAIQRFNAGNPKNNRGTHRYALEDWGLRTEEVREGFERYTDTYL